MWSLQDDPDARPRAPERVVPDGCLELIFHIGDPFGRWTESGVLEIQPRALVVGQLTKILMLQPGRMVDTFGVRFRPGEARRVLGLPLHELQDRDAPLETLMGLEGVELANRILDATDSASRVSEATAWLRRRLARGPAPHPALRHAVGAVLRRRGRMRIDRLAHEVGWSVRQLERGFLLDVGSSPKRFGRTVRLNALLAGMQTQSTVSWADLALELGFADQSHLVREFRALVGTSPAAPEALHGVLMASFTSPQRLAAYFVGD